ncbi:MAG: FG-GAP repeat domain-containing protein, partial [Nitrososphaerales archaeon]
MLLSVISTITIYPQYIPSYIESSSGLNNPFLDGGRTEVELADINADGHLDIISVGDHGSPYINTNEHGIMVWFGNGTGSGWSVIQWGNFGYGGVAVGDVN